MADNLESFHEKELLEKKPEESYSKSLKDNINIISYDPDNLQIYGTYSYKGQPYAGDVDMLEKFVECCSPEDVINKFMPKLKNILTKIKNDKTVFFLEMKCGFDSRYLPLFIGIPIDNKLVGYEQDNFLKHSKQLYNSKLFKKEEYEEIKKYAVENPSRFDYEKLLEIYRKYFQLRWTIDEVLKGYKLLPLDAMIPLQEALLMLIQTQIKEGNIIKIDMVGNVNGRFLEFSNLFMLRYVTKKNSKREIDINLPERYENLVNSLRAEVNKWGFSPISFKPFKMVKRLWVLARIFGDIAMNEKLEKLYRSGASLLSQINSEISAIQFVLEQKDKKIPMKEIKEQIDTFKSRIVYNIDVKIDTDKIIEHLDKILNMNEPKKIVIELKNIKKYLDENIAIYTIEYLKDKSLYPPPNKYMPQ